MTSLGDFDYLYRAMTLFAQRIVALLNALKEGFARLLATTKEGESHHPLRLAEWIILEVVAYIYI